MATLHRPRKRSQVTTSHWEDLNDEKDQRDQGQERHTGSRTCPLEGVFELLSSNDRILFYGKRSSLVRPWHDQERLAWTLDCYRTRCMSRFIRVI